MERKGKGKRKNKGGRGRSNGGKNAGRKRCMEYNKNMEYSIFHILIINDKNMVKKKNMKKEGERGEHTNKRKGE